MSWSLPRLNLRPQRDNRSRELSVSRPLFCMAIFSRISGFAFMSGPAFMSGIRIQPIGDGAVAAVSRRQVASHPADRGDADAGLPVDLAIGQAALEKLDHRPAVRHGLQFGGRAQVAEETAAFLNAAQRQNRSAEVALVLLFLADGDGTVGLHGTPSCINALVH